MEFNENAYLNGEIKKISLSDYKGKWVILFFYPADFTFICPTELRELSNKYEEIKNMNAEIISISVDTAFVHKAWHDSSPSIRDISFPMLADPTHKVCIDYGTYIESDGISTRATFLIDPDGIIKAFEFHDNNIGRSSDELLRKLSAAIYTRENNGEVCPMNWSKGKSTIKPSTELIGSI